MHTVCFIFEFCRHYMCIYYFHSLILLGDTTVKVDMERGHFTILHCQRSLPINYDIAGWRQRAREHPSTRVVGQVLAESKKKSISCLFQGRGVASLSNANTSATSLSTDATTAMRVGRTLSFSNPTAGIKKSSICLRTKFQLVSHIINVELNKCPGVLYCT